MGLYDREYGRPDDTSWQPGIHLGGARTLTTNLVLITAGVYLLQLFTEGWVTRHFSLYDNTLTKPWLLYQFLSYGFLHSPENKLHIIFNMFGLWMFGRTVEAKYGRKEFLSFYLAAIVVAGVSWYLTNLITKNPNSTSLLFGASGGVSAVLVLFAINYPRQNIYIWGVLPVPAWAFVVFLVGSDLLGFVKSANASLDSTRSNVAFTAHLGGALFAYLYYRNQWRVSNWIPGKLSLPRTGPKLRIHDPEDRDDKTDQKVDEILKKIQAHGQDSLTRSERRTLEKASKAYQKKNR